MFAAKEYRQGRETLLAVCDEECLGQHYREGKLTLKVDEDFYDGQRIDGDALRVALERATVGNFVGERTVEVAKDMGLVAEGNVIWIDGVPHAQWAVLF